MTKRLGVLSVQPSTSRMISKRSPHQAAGDLVNIFDYLFNFLLFGLRGRVYVPCINHMPGGVIVGDLGLSCCMPIQSATSIARVQLLPTVC